MKQTDTSKTLHIYTDGACRGNPGKGGWGALLKFGDHEKRIYGAEIHTTNNRMELLAVISALAELKHSCHITLTTDSKYVLQGITEWLPKWQKNNWRNSGNKPVKNKDLWERLDHEITRHKIEWEWVRGHSGHVENTIADQLATSAIDLLLNTAKKKC